MSGETILIVEDDDILRGYLGDSLAGLGYEILEAASGGEGLALASQRVPDLVLLDLGLPDGDGLTVARKLRETPETAAIVLAVITGEEISGARAQEVYRHCIGYIPKPISFDRLARNVTLFLRVGRAGAKAVQRSPADSDHPRRRHPRFSVEVGVLCRLRSGEKHESEDKVAGLIRTMSEGGVLLEIPRMCPKGALLEISLRTDETRLRPLAEVVWIGQPDTVKGVGQVFRHGLRFVRMTREQRNTIRRFLLRRFTT